jgi:Zn finger protein HypA/HybF involved in hydrogenase expression
MHEFAIATDIINTIKTKYEEEFKNLTSINIVVGNFSGTIIDSLELGLDTVLKDYDLNDVKIIISEKNATALCECGQKYNLKDVFDLCPKCNSLKRELVSGTDVFIDTIEFEK